MKTEELEKMGLSKEQIKEVFKINGQDIEAEKQKRVNLETDNATLKKRAEEAEDTLKGFEGKDFNKISGELETWKKKYETDTKNFQKQIHERDYNDAIREHVSGIQFTSESAKKAYVSELKAADLTMKDGKVFGLTDFLSSYKETDADAFVKDTKKPTTPAAKVTQPLGTQTTTSSEVTGQNFKKMSYEQLREMKENEPEKYKQLSEGE